MRLTGDFLIRMEQLQGLAADDNRFGDSDFVVRNVVTAELTYTLAMFTREDSAPLC